MNRTNASSEITPLDVGEIAQRIQTVRGHRVIMDADLAAFYGESTKRFNQQVRRNLARFPADFMFQLDADEAQSLRLQFATLETDRSGKPGRGRYSKYLPLAFTEHGAIMAATLLNSARATEISVHVVRAFVQWRSMLAANRELSQKLHTLQRKVSSHDESIADLVESMRQLLTAPPEPPKRPIGFITEQDFAKDAKPKNAAGAAKTAKTSAKTAMKSKRR